MGKTCLPICGRRCPLWPPGRQCCSICPCREGLPSTREFLPLLPNGLRAFALYVQAHSLYLREDYAKSVGMAEAALAMGAEAYPISAIYLHLVAVMDYMRLRQLPQAQGHLLAAWTLARPMISSKALVSTTASWAGCWSRCLREIGRRTCGGF